VRREALGRLAARDFPGNESVLLEPGNDFAMGREKVGNRSQAAWSPDKSDQRDRIAGSRISARARKKV
jgi:hypothetical protein